jgi:hypothetical protein
MASFLLYALFYFSLFYYGISSTFPQEMPPFLNYFDKIVVSAMFFLTLYFYQQTKRRYSRSLLLVTVALCCVLTLSSLYNGVSLLTTFKFIVSYAKPFVIVFFVSSGILSFEKCRRFLLQFLLLVFLQIPIAIYQAYRVGFAVNGINSDVVRGIFFSDWTLAVVAIYSLLYFAMKFSLNPQSAGLRPKMSVKDMAAIIGLLVLFIFTSSVHMIPGIFIIILVYILRPSVKSLFRNGFLFAILLFAIIKIGLPLFGYDTLSAAGRYLQNVSRIPKFEVWEYIVSQFSSNHLALMLGLGPGQVASNFQGNSNLYRLFPDLVPKITASVGSVLSRPGSTFLAVLGESGIIGLLLYYVSPTYWVVKSFRDYAGYLSPYEQVVVRWGGACVLFLMYESVFDSVGEYLFANFIPSFVVGYALLLIHRAEHDAATFLRSDR